jgi:putative phosphoribosyl transferase
MPEKDSDMFEDRRHAGRRLGARLAQHRATDPVVIGLPRGGLVVADEVARALEAPLDVVVVRKLRAPHDCELGIGALAGGAIPEVVLDEGAVSALGVAPEYVCEEVETQLREVRLREALLREGQRPIPVADRTVIVVDDGIATGGTVRAALQAIRHGRPRRILLAVPVAPAEILRLLEPLVDRVVCLRAPRRFDAVGDFYREFEGVSDGEVVTLLAEARARTAKVASMAAAR